MLLAYAYFASDHIIFPGYKTHYKNEPNFLKLTTADKKIISALYLPNKNAKYTIFVSHGNAEDIGRELSFLHALHDHGFAVFAYEYHGYGLLSTGTPSEHNTYLDVNAAYNYLTKNLYVAPKNIISYGFSLGVAPALDLAVRQPVAAVILQGPFVTAFRIKTHFPIFPFDKFNNLEKITKLKYPVLIIHGTDDKTIPFWHGQKLYSAANEPKQFYVVEKAGHRIPTDKEYWTHIKKFVRGV